MLNLFGRVTFSRANDGIHRPNRQHCETENINNLCNRPLNPQPLYISYFMFSCPVQFLTTYRFVYCNIVIFHFAILYQYSKHCIRCFSETLYMQTFMAVDHFCVALTPRLQQNNGPHSRTAQSFYNDCGIR